MLKNQKGFTAFEAIIVVLALIAIGAAGYYAYQAQQDKTNYSASISKNKPATSVNSPESTANVPVFTVKELGIQFNLPSDINDLVYTYSDGVARFSTSSLEAAGGKYCTPDGDSPLGLVSLKPQLGTGDTAIKTLDGKYLIYLHTQSACSEDSKALELAGKQVESFKAALKTAELTK